MHLRNLNIIIMLIAGIIVTIISIISKYTLEQLVYTLLIVLVIFFVLGTVIQGLLNRITEKADYNAREKEKALLDKEVQRIAEDEQAFKKSEDES